MPRLILSEQDALRRVSEGLSQAIDGARMMKHHRPDVAFMWEKMAEAFEVNRMSIWKLAGEAAIRTMGRKDGGS